MKTKFRIFPPGYTYAKRYFLIPAVLQIIAGMLLVSLPVLTGQAIEYSIAGQQTAALTCIVGIVGIALVLSLNEFIGWKLTAQLNVVLERDWRTYAAGLFTQHRKGLDPGEMIAVINQDSRFISNMVQSIPGGVGAIALALMGAAQLISVSPLIALVAFAGIALTITATTVFSRFLESKAEARRESIGVSASTATDIASALRTVAGLGIQKTMLHRYRRSTAQLRDSSLEYQRVETWSMALNVFLTGLTTLISVGLALRGNVQDGVWVAHIPAGQLVVIAGVIALMSSPIWVVQQVLWGWRQAKVSLARIEKLEAQEEVETESSGQLVEVPAGKGLIYVNPKDFGMTSHNYALALASALKAEDSQVLRSESNAMIFAGTLRETVQAGSLHLDDAHVNQLLALTDSVEIAERLGGPVDYLEAQISAEGANLSGGQRQRLALARALAQPASNLVLAEPLNSVDEPSQAYIFDQLEQALRNGDLGRTERIFVVSTTAEVSRRIAQKAGE